MAKVYQDVIADICHKMGLGMAEFLEKKVNSNEEWDKVSELWRYEFWKTCMLAITIKLTVQRPSKTSIQ